MPTDPRYDYSLMEPRFPRPVDRSLENADIDLDVRLAMYRKLQELRQFGKRAHDLFLQNLVKGTTHLSLGMEAIATGFGAAMQPGDYTFATYRGHAHSLARGMDLGAAMAELLGRENGVLGGKGGSMHLTDVEKGMMGSYAIIGAHLCIANGAAWSAQMRGTDQVAVAFFGDGTTNIGAFHEALNMAKIWDLPVVFVCENNFYMEYTPIEVITAVDHPAADRASAYGLESIIIDGNDPDAVYLAAIDALRKARTGEGPTLIEALTYRSGGHSRADPAKYRPEAEVAAWSDRDPIPVYHERLLATGAPEVALTNIEHEVADAIDAATEFAKSGRELVPGMIVLGMGVGLFYSSITTVSITAVNDSRASLAGAIIYMFQIAGGSIGLGLNTAIVVSRSSLAEGIGTAFLLNGVLALLGLVIVLLFIGNDSSRH